MSNVYMVMVVVGGAKLKHRCLMSMRWWWVRAMGEWWCWRGVGMSGGGGVGLGVG